MSDSLCDYAVEQGGEDNVTAICVEVQDPGVRPTFVETQAGPTIRMRLFRQTSDGSLVGKLWFGEAAFGPPGFVHGGGLRGNPRACGPRF